MIYKSYKNEIIDVTLTFQEIFKKLALYPTLIRKTQVYRNLFLNIKLYPRKAINKIYKGQLQLHCVSFCT